MDTLEPEKQRPDQKLDSHLRVMSFQPSELAKLFIILYFAGAFYRKSLKTPMINLQPNHIIYPILVWIGIIFCVANETDIGAVLIISGIAVAVVAASGIRIQNFFKFFAVLAGFGAAIIGILLLLKGDSIF